MAGNAELARQLGEVASDMEREEERVINLEARQEKIVEELDVSRRRIQEFGDEYARLLQALQANQAKKSGTSACAAPALTSLPSGTVGANVPAGNAPHSTTPIAPSSHEPSEVDTPADFTHDYKDGEELPKKRKIRRNEGPVSLSKEYMCIVEDGDQWIAISCHICNANANANKAFFQGVHGLSRHVTRAHAWDPENKPGWEDVHRMRKKQILSAHDVALLEAGEVPEDAEIEVWAAMGGGRASKVNTIGKKATKITNSTLTMTGIPETPAMSASAASSNPSRSPFKPLLSPSSTQAKRRHTSLPEHEREVSGMLFPSTTQHAEKRRRTDLHQTFGIDGHGSSVGHFDPSDFHQEATFDN